MSRPYAITTLEELEAEVGALLRRVYVDEWGKRLALAPGRARRARDRTLIAIDRDGVAGTACLTLASALSAEERRRFRLEHFASAVPLRQLAVGGRLAVAPRLRSSGLALDLVKAAARAALEGGVKLLFTLAQPHLLNFYDELGFTPYAPVVSREGVGVVSPVVLDLTEPERVARLGAPLADLVPAAGQPTLRGLIERTPGHEARCRVARELGEALADERALARLDPAVAAALLRRAHLVPCGPGDLIVSRGQATRTLFLVLDGAVHLVDGGDVTHVVGPGGVAGEVSYLLGVKQRHDLRAGPGGARLLALPVQAFAGGDDELVAEAFLMLLVAAISARCPHAASAGRASRRAPGARRSSRSVAVVRQGGEE